jgi:putative peptidoglycan lipid II flippase
MSLATNLTAFPTAPTPKTRWSRIAGLLRPSHEHTPISAAMLLVSALCVSRLLGYVREAYVASVFGAGANTDAYIAAFSLPDTFSCMLAAGSVGITVTSILARYRAENREEVAQQGINVMMTVVLVILALGITVLELTASKIEPYMFPNFTPAQLELCVRITRILLPGKIFYYLGGAYAAVLLSRRWFLVPSTVPLLYNVCIILSGVVAARRFGITSLAFGVVAGLFIGHFFLNAISAGRSGFHFRPSFDIHNPAFREWVRLSVPLGLGISILMADSLYQRYFASGSPGDISRLYYARQLFTVPLGILGQTAGQASLPFFARLFGEKRSKEFGATVNKAVTGIFTLSILGTTWFMAAALPVVDLVYRRGRFQFSDSQQTAVYLLCFSLALGFWAIQVLYARAFFAAGDSLTPMVGSTIVTIIAFPIYAVMFRMFSIVGLVIASDIAIVLDTTVLAVLLHRRHLVPLNDLRWLEIGKVMAVASFAGLTAWGASQAIPLHGSRKDDLVALGLISLAWGGTALLGIWLTGSQLLDYVKRARWTGSSLRSPRDSAPLNEIA